MSTTTRSSLTTKQYAAILITQHEKFSPTPYTIAPQPDVWTIGFGTTIQHNVKVTQNTPALTREQGMMYVEQYIDVCYKDLFPFFPSHAQAYEVGSVLSLAYNAGVTPVATSTLIKCIAADDFVLAQSKFPMWSYVAGQLNRGLLYRRMSEQYTFASGKFDFTFQEQDYRLLINPNGPVVTV